jgi:hypothetical protein
MDVFNKMKIFKEGSIFSPKFKKEDNYQIVTCSDDRVASYIDDNWQTCSVNRVFELKKTVNTRDELKSLISNENLSDFHWKWSDIISDTAQDSYKKVTFYLLVGNKPEGILHVYFPKNTRLEPTKNLVYVDRVAVAPWNRPHQQEKHYKGVGSILMLFICNYSNLKGYDGCIGLHSLPQAEPFYRHLGMVDLGIDGCYEGLIYFELAKEKAKELISEDE